MSGLHLSLTVSPGCSLEKNLLGFIRGGGRGTTGGESGDAGKEEVANDSKSSTDLCLRAQV